MYLNFGNQLVFNKKKVILITVVFSLIHVKQTVH